MCINIPIKNSLKLYNICIRCSFILSRILCYCLVHTHPSPQIIIIHTQATKQKVHGFWGRHVKSCERNEKRDREKRASQLVLLRCCHILFVCIAHSTRQHWAGKNTAHDQRLCVCALMREKLTAAPSTVVSLQYLSAVLVFTIRVHSHFPLSITLTPFYPPTHSLSLTLSSSHSFSLTPSLSRSLLCTVLYRSLSFSFVDIIIVITNIVNYRVKIRTMTKN